MRHWSLFSFQVKDKSGKNLINIGNHNGPTSSLPIFLLENLSHIGSHQHLAEDQAWSCCFCFCLGGGWRILSNWWWILRNWRSIWNIWYWYWYWQGCRSLFSDPLARHVEASACVANAHLGLMSHVKSKYQMLNVKSQKQKSEKCSQC